MHETEAGCYCYNTYTMNGDTYIVAVSGGVDSVVLLDMLMRQEHETDNGLALISALIPQPSRLVVAHFDHGTREGSGRDAQFVQHLASTYGLQFELGTGQLGSGASEDMARKARYKFLRQCSKKYNAKLITAHHQDDLIETIILNIIRGTGWRGLIAMEQLPEHRFQNGDDQLPCRPLLYTPKSTLLAYARKHQLTWREDSTNQDQKYLRNYIRHTLIPSATKKDTQFKQKLLNIHTGTHKLKKEIATNLQNITSQSKEQIGIRRYALLMWPQSVALEAIYTLLTELDADWHPKAHHVKKALNFAKTALPGKELIINKQLKIISHKDKLQFKKC